MSQQVKPMKLVLRASQGSRQAGFSLVEMMISMLLGLMILAAAIAVFYSNRASYQANQGLARVQENARVAFELMARDIRAAGSTGCSNAAKPETATTDWPEFPSQPVSGHGPGAVAGSTGDSIEVLSAGDAPIGIESQTATTLTLRTDVHPFQDNDILVVCDAAKVFVFEATDVTDEVITHAGLPGGWNFFDNIMPSSASVVVATLAANHWYVAPNPRGGSSLWVSRTGGAGEEVAEGVQDMTISYLERGQTDYNPTPGSVNWANLIAVKVQMSLGAVDPRGNAINRNIENVVSLRTQAL